MYDIKLTESLFPPQTDGELRDITVGELLRETAEKFPDSIAMVDIALDGSPGQQWNYSELLTISEKLALALASRFEPGEKVVVWAPNIPAWLVHGICLRTGRSGAGNRESLVPGQGITLCA